MVPLLRHLRDRPLALAITPALVGAALVLAVGPLVLPGCRGCSSVAPLWGVVTDRHGRPVAGASIEACHGTRCLARPDDDPCAASITDGRGRFAIEVPTCHPRPRTCELRPLVVTKRGCPTLIVQPEHTGTVHLRLEC